MYDGTNDNATCFVKDKHEARETIMQACEYWLYDSVAFYACGSLWSAAVPVSEWDGAAAMLNQ